MSERLRDKRRVETRKRKRKKNGIQTNSLNENK
jgi:hypothetical protein